MQRRSSRCHLLRWALLPVLLASCATLRQLQFEQPTVRLEAVESLGRSHGGPVIGYADAPVFAEPYLSAMPVPAPPVPPEPPEPPEPQKKK